MNIATAAKPAVADALEAHRAVFPIDFAETSFVLGRETPAPTMRPDLLPWREKRCGCMTRNVISTSDYVQFPPQCIIELGTQVEL